LTLSTVLFKLIEQTPLITQDSLVEVKASCWK